MNKYHTISKAEIVVIGIGIGMIVLGLLRALV